MISTENMPVQQTIRMFLADVQFFCGNKSTRNNVLLKRQIERSNRYVNAPACASSCSIYRPHGALGGCLINGTPVVNKQQHFTTNHPPFIDLLYIQAPAQLHPAPPPGGRKL